MINEKNCIKGTTGTFFKCATPKTAPDVIKEDGTMYWIEKDHLIRKSRYWGEVEDGCSFTFKGFSLSKEKTGIASYSEMKPYDLFHYAFSDDTSSEILEYLTQQAIETDFRKPLPWMDIFWMLEHPNSSRKVLEYALNSSGLHVYISIIHAIIRHPMVTEEEKAGFLMLLKGRVYA